MPEAKHLSDVPTPFAVVDAFALDHNIALMAGRLRERGVKHKPHTKTHKCLQIAAAQLKAGASGLTCATLGEARAMATVPGVSDVTIARAIGADAAKHEALATLARSVRLTLVVEDIGQVEGLGEACRRMGSTLNLLVELDIGFGRAGLRDVSQLAPIVDAIGGHGSLRFEGLMGYEAHAMRIRDDTERRGAVHEALDRLEHAKGLLEHGGHDVAVVSVGGTITYASASEHRVTTEVRSGGYVFMHATSAPPNDDLKDFRRALSVHMTVIGSYEDKIVLDGGLKSISVDGGLHMHADGLAGAEVAMITEEHLVLDVSRCDRRPRTGERVRLTSTHSCTTANLHSRYLVVNGEDEAVQDEWAVVGRY